MPSSKPDKPSADATESSDFRQLGLDFPYPDGYSQTLFKEGEAMDQELFGQLEAKVIDLFEKYTALKKENARLAEENQRLLSERKGLKTRVTAIIGKLEGV